jgi:hypothetical protein
LSFSLQGDFSAGDRLLEVAREKALLEAFGVPTTAFQMNRHVDFYDEEDIGLTNNNIAGQDHHQDALDDTSTISSNVSFLAREPDNEEKKRGLFSSSWRATMPSIFRMSMTSMTTSRVRNQSQW